MECTLQLTSCVRIRRLAVRSSVPRVLPLSTPNETYPEYNGCKAAVLNYVFGMSRLHKNKENISINAVLPGIVRTNIIPPEMVTAVSPECVTPVGSITSAYKKFLADPNLFDQGIECSADHHVFVKRPEHLNGRFSERACIVWEPLFKANHGENSELKGAIP